MNGQSKNPIDELVQRVAKAGVPTIILSAIGLPLTLETFTAKDTRAMLMIGTAATCCWVVGQFELLVFKKGPRH
jgi:hypothetical protein